MEKGQKDFETISSTVRKEIARFDRLRVADFKTSVIKYLEVLMDKQQQVIILIYIKVNKVPFSAVVLGHLKTLIFHLSQMEN